MCRCGCWERFWNPPKFKRSLDALLSKSEAWCRLNEDAMGQPFCQKISTKSYIRDVGASHALTNLEPLIQSWFWCLLTISAFKDPRMGIVTWQKMYAVTTLRWRWCEWFWQWEVYRNQFSVSDVLTVHAEFVCVCLIFYLVCLESLEGAFQSIPNDVAN